MNRQCGRSVLVCNQSTWGILHYQFLDHIMEAHPHSQNATMTTKTYGGVAVTLGWVVPERRAKSKEVHIDTTIAFAAITDHTVQSVTER